MGKADLMGEPMRCSLEKADNALSRQVDGGHYVSFPIQPVEFITKNHIGFCEGNVIKYVCRWRDKNGVRDLEKAKHYIDLLIELEQDGS